MPFKALYYFFEFFSTVFLKKQMLFQKIYGTIDKTDKSVKSTQRFPWLFIFTVLAALICYLERTSHNYEKNIVDRWQQYPEQTVLRNQTAYHG